MAVRGFHLADGVVNYTKGFVRSSVSSCGAIFRSNTIDVVQRLLTEYIVVVEQLIFLKTGDNIT